MRAMTNRDMGSLVDDVARILASPVPRRQVLKALSRALTGSVLAAFAVRQAESQTRETDEDSSECRPACSRGQTCCPGASGRPFCVSSPNSCCGDYSCGSNESCCTGTSGQKFSSGPGNKCCGDHSFGPTQQCCRTGSQPFACDHTLTCCGNTSCRRDETCCGNKCCGEDQDCKHGKCEVSKH